MSTSSSPTDSLAEALIDAQDQLLALYELATLTTESLDEDECVDPILQRAARLLSADEVTFVIGQAFPPAGSSAMTFVVENSSGLSGALTARRDAKPFGTADQKLLRAVANIALGAVQTSRLHADAVAQAVVARDHDTASELAQLALPSWRPQVPGLDVFARSDPARTAGGDLFTFVETPTSLHFVVGDVSGKGLPAAMIMTTIISSANAAMHSHGADPLATLGSIDSWMYDYLSGSGLFVTIVAGSIDTTTRELRLANAGHSPVVAVQNGVPSMLAATAPPIGVLPLSSTAIAEDRLTLSPHDRLVVCSDGFSEQLDARDNMFGDDRLLQRVADLSNGAHDHGSTLFEELDEFAVGAAQTDDRTLVIIDFHRESVSRRAA